MEQRVLRSCRCGYAYCLYRIILKSRDLFPKRGMHHANSTLAQSSRYAVPPYIDDTLASWNPMKRLEQAIKEQQKRDMFLRIKESRTGIAFLIIIIVALTFNIYKSLDKASEQSHLSGVLVGMHQVQSNLGSTTTKLSIRLENGETILVTAPAEIIIRSGAEVDVIRLKTTQGSVYHYFSGYK